MTKQEQRVPNDAVKKAIAEARHISRSVSEFQPETYLAVLLSCLLRDIGDASALRLEAIPMPRRQGRQSQVTVAELFARVRPRTDVEKVLTAAYALDAVHGLDAFNVDDLQRCIRQAKQKLPGNINDSVNKNIRKGFLAEHTEKKSGKKAWHIAPTGAASLQARLKSAVASRASVED